MKKNVGPTDKIIRLVIAAIFVLVYFVDFLPAPFGYVALGLAAIMVLTATFNFCPLYAPFGIKTCPKK